LFTNYQLRSGFLSFHFSIQLNIDLIGVANGKTLA
jgi:hypothetical protein